jgi:hypothetical protein
MDNPQKIRRHQNEIKKEQPTEEIDEGKEQAAIAICTKTVLQSRGRTLKRFSCKKGPKLLTAKYLK